MAVITIYSDFGAPKNKVSHCFHCFPIYLSWSDGTGCHDLSFLNVSFKPTFSVSSFTFHTGTQRFRLFVSSGPATSVHAFLSIMVGEKRVRALPTDSWMFQPRSASCSWPIAQIPSRGMGAHGWKVNSTCLIQGVFSILRKWCKLTASDSVKIQALSMSLFFKSACLMKHI